MKQSEQVKLEQQIKSVLDQSVKDIDADTLYKLQMMRAKTLQSNDVANVWYIGKSIWMSAVGFASVSLLVVLLMISPSDYEMNDMDIISNVDEFPFEADAAIELYEQYDFYVWLTKQEVNS